MTLPRQSVTSSSSSNDAGLDEACPIGDSPEGEDESGERVAAKGLEEMDTEVPDAVGDARAEKKDCDTSESRSDARFWLFVNLWEPFECIKGARGRFSETNRRTSRLSVFPPISARRSAQRFPSKTTQAERPAG